MEREIAVGLKLDMQATLGHGSVLDLAMRLVSLGDRPVAVTAGTDPVEFFDETSRGAHHELVGDTRTVLLDVSCRSDDS